LSANYSSTDRPLAPASYAINWDSTSSTTRKNYQTKYKALLDALGLESDEYMKDVVIPRECQKGKYFKRMQNISSVKLSEFFDEEDDDDESDE
jgi:hypothetical protein